jgi:hypothetical protein
VILACQIYHKRRLLERLRTRRLKSSEAPGAGTINEPSTTALPEHRGRSGAQTDGPANSAGQSAYDQRHQPPHKARKDTQGQSTYGRLIKAGPTFDQLLSKSASKKTVLHDRSMKKPRSPAKTKRPNKLAWKATQQASPIHPMRPRYFPPVYSSSVYYHVQIWNAMTMNPWYMYSPFVYPDWGTPPLYFF